MKKHHHKHECAHESVKFCAECAKVYCEKCGEEWTKYAPPPFYTKPLMDWPQTTPNLPSTEPWKISWTRSTSCAVGAPANVTTDTCTIRQHQHITGRVGAPTPLPDPSWDEG